jgi:hypothetical protein
MACGHAIQQLFGPRGVQKADDRRAFAQQIDFVA